MSKFHAMRLRFWVPTTAAIGDNSSARLERPCARALKRFPFVLARRLPILGRRNAPWIRSQREERESLATWAGRHQRACRWTEMHLTNRAKTSRAKTNRTKTNRGRVIE
jgi:hypothetical protein